MTEFLYENVFIKNTLEFHKRSFSSLNYIHFFFSKRYEQNYYLATISRTNKVTRVHGKHVVQMKIFIVILYGIKYLEYRK